MRDDLETGKDYISLSYVGSSPEDPILVDDAPDPHDSEAESRESKNGRKYSPDTCSKPREIQESTKIGKTGQCFTKKVAGTFNGGAHSLNFESKTVSLPVPLYTCDMDADNVVRLRMNSLMSSLSPLYQINSMEKQQ